MVRPPPSSDIYYIGLMGGSLEPDPLKTKNQPSPQNRYLCQNLFFREVGWFFLSANGQEDLTKYLQKLDLTG